MDTLLERKLKEIVQKVDLRHEDLIRFLQVKLIVGVQQGLPQVCIDQIEEVLGQLSMMPPPVKNCSKLFDETNNSVY